MNPYLPIDQQNIDEIKYCDEDEDDMGYNTLEAWEYPTKSKHAQKRVQIGAGNGNNHSGASIGNGVF